MRRRIECMWCGRRFDPKKEGRTFELEDGTTSPVCGECLTGFHFGTLRGIRTTKRRWI